jgi:hypothetical protein
MSRVIGTDANDQPLHVGDMVRHIKDENLGEGVVTARETTWRGELAVEVQFPRGCGRRAVLANGRHGRERDARQGEAAPGHPEKGEGRAEDRGVPQGLSARPPPTRTAEAVGGTQVT